MKVLVVGSGGREYAIAWKLLQSPEVERVYLSPGNGGTALLPGCENLPYDPEEPVTTLRDARRREVGLVVIGPEVPIVAGVADLFENARIPVVGPSRQAAALEGSKIFAKEFMGRHGVPTAGWRVAETPKEAMDAVDSFGLPVVIKADGLAAGKGVVVASSREEAEEAVTRFMVEQTLGSAGSRLLVEECLQGPELSLFALTDGSTYEVLATAMDHKPIGEGNTGPNTGGMGVTAPHPQESPHLLSRLRREVLEPTVGGLAEERLRYRGVIFVGLMLTDKGPRVLEYNVRLGDPETQALLPLLKSDLLPMLRAAAEGRLEAVQPVWRKEVAVTVVAASGGYPGSYERGFSIGGIDPPASRNALWEREGLPVPFVAGAELSPSGELQTAGGRVVAVTALGATIEEAREEAYNRLSRITFRGIYYRRDIPFLGE
jgi:phosphoribosylamine--glycine ligase